MQTTRRPSPSRIMPAPDWRWRGRSLAAAGASCALIAAGCGAFSPANTTAAVATFNATTYKYSACMRDHGSPDFPDPTMTDHNGEQVEFLDPSGAVVAAPGYKSAEVACRGVIPAPQSTSPTALAQARKARTEHLLAFAKCVRDHGLEHFPDPTSQGQLTAQMINAAGVDPQAPPFRIAATACLGSAGGAVTARDVQRAVSGSN